MKNSFDINLQTKVGKMLDIYPQLEEVLLSLSPSFAKLKNPVLRKTVARVASLRQIAEVGGLDAGEMISTLRKAVGMDVYTENGASTQNHQDAKPEWTNINNVGITFEASDIIDKGESPMKIILEKSDQLDSNSVMLLVTPFTPTPIIELLNSKGFRTWSENMQDGKVNTYITK